MLSAALALSLAGCGQSSSPAAASSAAPTPSSSAAPASAAPSPSPVSAPESAPSASPSASPSSGTETPAPAAKSTQTGAAQYDRELYTDVLATYTNHIDGTEDRLTNVTLAAQAINGVVVLPSADFSYNDTLGPRTEKKGYKPAPSYSNGKTVNTVGGGICQVSSTLYYCCVYADLSIVSRRNHSYVQTYVPAGLDAAVSYDSLDYQFRNSTDYPVKISAQVDGRTLTVTLYGTKTDDHVVKTEIKTLSTTDYKKVLKADDSVPAGTVTVSVTPYAGQSVEVYRCVYDGSGKLLSRKLENKSTYKVRDEVVLYNPADGEPDEAAVSAAEASAQVSCAA